MFEGHVRFIVVSFIIGVAGCYFVLVPIAQAYFESDNHSCSEVLDENGKLVSRMMEMSALLRKYTELDEVQERRNESISEMVVERAMEEDTISAPIQIIDGTNQEINKQKELLIEEMKKVTVLEK